jgi:hypothetical protein
MSGSAVVVVNNRGLKQNSFSGHINEQYKINFMSWEGGGGIFW